MYVHCLLRITAGYVVGPLPTPVPLTLSLSSLHIILEIDQCRKELFSCRHVVLPWINTEKTKELRHHVRSEDSVGTTSSACNTGRDNKTGQAQNMDDEETLFFLD